MYISTTTRHLTAPDFPFIQVTVASPMPYVGVGLLYCGIDTTQPGTYTVTFSVVYDKNASVSVQRTVVVQALCSSGEQACSDGTCGEWGG